MLIMSLVPRVFCLTRHRGFARPNIEPDPTFEDEFDMASTLRETREPAKTGRFRAPTLRLGPNT